MPPPEPKRGEVWWVSFDPSLGGETRKTRPAIVISNDFANRILNRVQVLPLTSNVTKLYPAEAYVTVNNQKSKAMADQITTATKERLREKLGEVSKADMMAIERAVRTQLGL